MRNVQLSMFFNWKIKGKSKQIKLVSWLENLNFQGFHEREREECGFYKLFIRCLVLVVEVWRWCCGASKCIVKWEWKKTPEPIIDPTYFANVVRHEKRWWVSMPFASHTQNRTWHNQQNRTVSENFWQKKDFVAFAEVKVRCNLHFCLHL